MAAARLLSTEDLVLEILYRVSTDVAALFRCSVACKRWRALIASRSFLRRCWPARSPSTLVGFFDRQRMDDPDMRRSYRLFFVPPPAGSVLGTQRHLVTSIVDGLPDDDSRSAMLLAARRGLLLVRLVSSEISFFESAHMAVCDQFGRTCHVLPPLECRVSMVSCTVLTGAECGRGSSDYFKVLAIVFFSNAENNDDQECSLYTFSSTDSCWSGATKLFNEIYRLGNCGFQFPLRNAIVCGTMAHWLIPYCYADFEEPTKYYTLDVSADTCHTLLTEIPIPANQIMSLPTLRVTADGSSLSLFCIDDEALIWRLHIWQRVNTVDSQVWLRTRVIQLNLPRQPSELCDVRTLPVENSHTLILIDKSKNLVQIDLQTGEVEEQQFQDALSMLSLPMSIDWPTWFASQLLKFQS
jgi:hypothetical protein